MASPHIKLRRMKWMGCVAHMGQRRNVYKILIGKAEEKRHFRYLG
jgi:hypothetical protein